MVTYILRRLIGSVVLLVIISIVTFGIFFVMPRIAGATPESLASRYVGRTASQAQVDAAAKRLGFTDPLYVQYGRWAKGIVVGADFDTGPSVEHCPAPCFGYSFINRRPVFPDLLDRMRDGFDEHGVHCGLRFGGDRLARLFANASQHRTGPVDSPAEYEYEATVSIDWGEGGCD